MIQSMTGYGKAIVELPDKKINVEIKSLNSKAMDLSARIAPAYREKEMEIRNEIARVLERGKVDFSLWVEKRMPSNWLLPLIRNWWLPTIIVSRKSLLLQVFLSLKTGLVLCFVCLM